MVKCDICHFSNPTGFAYCGRCGNGLSGGKELSDSFVSSAIEGERKQVTIIFADISGFTALNDAANTPAEVEQVLQIVNHCLQLLSEVVYEYDGYIDKYMGDAIMAVFGAPRSHEDDPERALRTAIAMRERLEVFNLKPPFPLAEPLGIHLGINTGTVIAGLIGTNRKRSYTVMGDAVNVASRLEGVSERGEILVSQATYQLTNRLFYFKDREPVSVKGKKDPLVIYDLLGARSQRASQRGIAGLRSPMIGRYEELETFKNRMQYLQNKEGSIAVVIGEAGLGKSRLVNELHKEVSDNYPHVLWLEGRGLSYRQNLSYRLFIEILGTYLGIGSDDSGEVIWQKWQEVGETLFGDRHQEVTPYLATLMGIKLPEKITQSMPLSDPLILQQRMFMAVGEWVEAIALQQPFTLVFEDLHWADPNSVNLIQYLMTIPERLPLLLICITRPEREVDFWKVKEHVARDYPDLYTEFSLEPLTQQESRSLVDELLQVEHLPNQLENLILSRSEGNPLFMEEVLRSLIEDETLVKEGTSWVMARPVTEINIPHTLAGVLTSRIDRLDEPVKRTLQVASVIGRVFNRAILAAVADDLATDKEKFDRYLARLVAAELIKERSEGDEENEYIFKHVLTQETAYNSLLLQQRHIYHKRIADEMAPMYFLIGEEYAGSIAHHYEQGEVWSRALKYQVRAAEASKSTFDNTNAVHFYTKALATAQKIDDLDDQTQLNIYNGRGRTLKRLGKIDDAMADFEQALQLSKEADDLTTQMNVLGELGKLHQKFTHGLPYFEEALEIARQLDHKPGIVDMLNQLGNFAANMGQLEQSNTYFREALEIAEELGNTPRIASAQDGLANIILYRGQLQSSIELLEDITKIWRDIGIYQGLMKTYVSLTEAYTWQGNYDESERIWEEAADLEERTGDMNWAHQFRYYLAYNAFRQGDIISAQNTIAESIKISEQLLNDIWEAIGSAKQGYYNIYLGYVKKGIQQIEAATKLAEAIGSPLWMSRTNILLGCGYQLTGNLTQAQAILEKERVNIEQMDFKPDLIYILTALIQTYHLMGDWAKTPPLIETLQTLLDQTSMRTHQAKAYLLNGQSAINDQNYDMALKRLRQAQEIAEEINDKILQIDIQKTFITVYTNLDYGNEVQTHQQQTRHLINQIAATIGDKAIKTTFLSKSPLVRGVETIKA